MESKQRFQLLANAASVVQVQRLAKSSFRWLFVLAALAVLIGSFRSGPLQIAWFVLAALFALVAFYSLASHDTSVALLLQLGITLLALAYSAYTVLVVRDGGGLVFGAAAIGPIISAFGRYRTLRSVRSVPPEYVAQVATVFRHAIKDDPETTPNLIALRRSSSFWAVMTNKDKDYEYRLVYEGDLVFLIGRKSFLGLPYSPHIRVIAPVRSFHVDVVSESWSGRGKRVNLVLDTDSIFPTLEISPEMLEKAQRQPVCV